MDTNSADPEVQLTAAQVMAHAKHIKIDFQNIEMPQFCAQIAEEEINAFSDGSVKHPDSKVCALGSAGVWVPLQMESEKEEDAKESHRRVSIEEKSTDEDTTKSINEDNAKAGVKTKHK